MKQALWFILLTIAALEAAHLAVGYDAVANVVYGAIAMMALFIALTFLWLWFERTTPLAIGMVASWLGIAAVAAWWWAYNLMDAPDWADKHPAIFGVLALPIVGSVLHFSVIQRSFGYHGAQFMLPIAVALGLSIIVYVSV